MYYDRTGLISFAHEALASMLSYNVGKLEAYLYLTNQIDLMHSSYELQCCIFDNDPIEYTRECDRVRRSCVL